MSNGCPVGQKPLEPRLQRLGPGQRVGIVVLAGREMDAPALGRAFPVEQVRPFVGIGDVVAVGIAVPPEIMGDLDIEGAVGIGEALEGDAELLAHDAARALAADEIAAADRLAAGRLGGDAVGILNKAGEARREPQIDQLVRLGELQRLLDDLDALALQHVGKARVVLQHRVIERGHEPFAAVPVMEHRGDDAARLDLVVKPDAVEHFEGCRVVRAGARHLVEEIVVAQLLDEGDANPRLGERQRQAQPHRPRADDDDAIVRRLGHGFGTTSFTAPTQPVWVRSKTNPSGP